ncbi:MAG TPA: transposase [Terriglobia bacterium]|nr:transposase [Terriglobia bacterium]
MARAVLPGVPHHITQRGSRRSDVFLDEVDRHNYLHIFRESCRQFGLRIWAYCLMTNHVHFVAVPEREDSLWRTFQRTHGMFASRFNIKYGFSGHLWQARPFSCALDETHLWAAIRYVELNPVRARIVVCAEDYPWSSASAHCGLEMNPWLDSDWLPANRIANWRQWLMEGNGSELDQRIRDRTFTGRPCGDDPFVRRVEEAIGRPLMPKKPGPKTGKHDGDADRVLWTRDRIDT